MDNFNLKKYLANNPLTKESLNEALTWENRKFGDPLPTMKDYKESLHEGQFSWMTQDTGEQIGSEPENTIDVYMIDNEGNSYHEPKYEGYGEFGGKDYYDLVAEMNGYTAEDVAVIDRDDISDFRGIGIALAFKKLEPASAGANVLFPALVSNPKDLAGWDFSEEAEGDENQSWYVADEEDDYDDEYDDYEDDEDDSDY